MRRKHLIMIKTSSFAVPGAHFIRSVTFDPNVVKSNVNKANNMAMKYFMP